MTQFFKMVGNSLGTVCGALISPLDGGASMRSCAAGTANAASNWADNVAGNVQAVGGAASGNMNGDEGTDDMREMDWFERLCAQLCIDVYKIEWNPLTNVVDTSKVPKGYGEWRRTGTNFPYYIIMEAGNEAILVLRGTHLTSGIDTATDLAANANLGVCGLVSIGDSVRGVQCSNAVKKLLQDGKKVWVTGHSLGGAVAWYLCYEHKGIQGIAFNPPAGPRPTQLDNLAVHCNGWDKVSWKWVWHKVANKHYDSKTSANGDWGHSSDCFYGLTKEDQVW